MSILDDGPLVTHRTPKTEGDQLPGKRPHYKDGVEEKWTKREANAIRGLAAGYHPNQVRELCRLKEKTLNGWMGNPYFMMEVQKLADHNLYRFRPAVIAATARRAIAGSSQHARIYLQMTRDLKDESFVKTANVNFNKDSLDELNPEQLDREMEAELNKLMGEHPGDRAERMSR